MARIAARRPPRAPARRGAADDVKRPAPGCRRRPPTRCAAPTGRRRRRPRPRPCPGWRPGPRATAPRPGTARRAPRGVKPTARSRPTSRSRCSRPRRKKSPARSSAATTRKKLKYTKYSPKSVVPRAACSACASHGGHDEARAARRPSGRVARAERRAASKRAPRPLERRARRGDQAHRRDPSQAVAPELLRRARGAGRPWGSCASGPSRPRLSGGCASGRPRTAGPSRRGGATP